MEFDTQISNFKKIGDSDPERLIESKKLFFRKKMKKKELTLSWV